VTGRSRRSKQIKRNAADAADLAIRLARDKAFRKRVRSAIEHGVQALDRTRRDLGVRGLVSRLAADQALLSELRSARRDLEKARERVDRQRRSHKFRNITVMASLAAVAGIPRLRERLVASVKAAAKLLSESPLLGNPQSTGEDANLDTMTKDELYARAQAMDLPNRSEMSKDELVNALRSRT